MVEGGWARRAVGLGVVVGLVLAVYLVGKPEPRAAVGASAVNSQVRVWARAITLTTDDRGASAKIANGQPGDSVWLDRIGVEAERADTATVSAGATTGQTRWLRYDNGPVRACGKAGDRPEIRCTRWTAAADRPPDRRLRAVERLLDRYDMGTGLWHNDPGIWQSANALTAVIDFAARTGDPQYLAYADATYRHTDRGVPAKTGYNDDELWWALAWIRAFDLTHDPRYRTAARPIVDGLDDQRASFCDGGLAWARVGTDPEQRPWTQVNAITNALYLTATAQLSTRVEPADRSSYLARAQGIWDWFTTRAGRALLDPSGLINDHLDRSPDGKTCALADEGTRWTYVQGALIGGLVALHRATGREDLLATADTIAAAATRAGSPFMRDGVLREPSATNCPGPECRDAETFKGVFVRNYRQLLDTGRSRTASLEFLAHQANSLPIDSDEFGFRWQGPARPDDPPDFATQAAALDALNAM
ncbi:glycoside hydrolase family 76 protein [Nocardia sp. CDC159]|uniref:Glycoside hydrolase family 76 protein n=1 Tax=Nocardia pulmonis TaxID=2951408 RepID=A0A9X2EA77_9NOCA|nr:MULTISPECIES: glycoside hydrolase family 76 protein [Nocardia]MCM6776614.1 glycoside hydrolase family 76 protein [Nocardia pulmonis]MCM6789237.1 glycoside hydrolase family 76 protein [Nocardia sp. CDC159]